MAFFSGARGLGEAVLPHLIGLPSVTGLFQCGILCSLVPPHLRESGPQLWVLSHSGSCASVRTREPAPGQQPTQDILRY